MQTCIDPHVSIDLNSDKGLSNIMNNNHQYENGSPWKTNSINHIAKLTRCIFEYNYFKGYPGIADAYQTRTSVVTLQWCDGSFCRLQKIW